ncbi:MAG TPA: hypothetical protein VFX86_02295 [Candidatus Saccharimonadales bacterium]|nr:hypothetical protein [Candidatus Saccharimonadales bacterium]
MNELLTLAILPVGLWLLFVFFRLPPVTLILSILVGKLFAEELAGGLYDLANGFISFNQNHGQLFLLILPVVLSLVLTRAKAPKSGAITNALPLLFAALTLSLLVLPYVGLSDKLGEEGQDIVASYQNYIISATGGIALLFAWLPDLRRNKHKH